MLSRSPDKRGLEAMEGKLKAEACELLLIQRRGQRAGFNEAKLQASGLHACCNR